MGAHTLGILLSPGVCGVVPSILQLPGEGSYTQGTLGRP